MINKITITASDGKVFTGTLDNYANLVSELNAYESDLKLKKEREEAERKAKKESTEKSLRKVTDAVDLVNKTVEEYEKTTGEKLEFITVNGKLTTRPATGLDYLLRLFA